MDGASGSYTTKHEIKPTTSFNNFFGMCPLLNGKIKKEGKIQKQKGLKCIEKKRKWKKYLMDVTVYVRKMTIFSISINWEQNKI